MEIAEKAFNCFFSYSFMFFWMIFGESVSLRFTCLFFFSLNQPRRPMSVAMSVCVFLLFVCCASCNCILFLLSPLIGPEIAWSDPRPHKIQPQNELLEILRMHNTPKKEQDNFSEKKKRNYTPAKKKIILRLEVFSVSRMRDFNFFNNHFLFLVLYFENEQE